MPLRKPWHTVIPREGEHWARLDWPSTLQDYVVTHVETFANGAGRWVKFNVAKGGVSVTDWVHRIGDDWGAWIMDDRQLKCAECGAYHDGLDYLCLSCRLKPVTKRLCQVLSSSRGT